jgi:hypothetical protein
LACGCVIIFLILARGLSRARTAARRVPTHAPMENGTTIDAIPRVMHTLTLAHERSFPLDLTRRANSEWTVRTYDVEEGREYVRGNCEERLEAYDGLAPTAFKADLLRYCILYTEGGVWIDDDIVVVDALDDLVRDARHELLLVYDRNVYKSAGGPGQVWNAFMCARPGSAVFERAMDKISENVRKRAVYYHSLYYTGPALLYDSIEPSDSVEYRWQMQTRPAMSTGSQRIADVATDREVLLHFKLPRTTTHYSTLSRSKAVYE